jgi:membrane protein
MNNDTTAPPPSTPPAAAPTPGPAPIAGHGIRSWWPLVKRAASAWIDDYAPSMGAALSYYTVFSLAPLLLLVISIAGLVFGEEAARGALFGQLAELMGSSAAKAIESLLVSVSKPASGVVGTVTGIVVLLIGATTVFGELQDALDRIWRAPVRSRSSGLWTLLRSRFLSFGMVLGIAFLLMVSLVLSAAVAALGTWWGGAFRGWEWLAQAINLVLGFALTTIVFALIYKLMPRVKVRWHDVWLGAAVTSLLFTVGRFLIGLYIGKSDIASGFGAAGSLIIVFVWVYYSAQIFLMGAEFTWVYANTFGSLRGTAAPATSPVGDPPVRSTAPPRTAVPAAAESALDAPALVAHGPASLQSRWTFLGVGVAVGAATAGGLLTVRRWRGFS